MPRLESFGADPALRASFRSLHPAPLLLGRVVEEARDLLTVALDDGDVPCTLAGRLRHEALRREDVPVVGDFVAVLRPPAGAAGHGVVRAVLPRRSLLVRKAVVTGGSQPIAANVDRVLLVTSANEDFSEGRLERYASLVWESGAQPVVVLTKTDLVDDPAPLVERAAAACPGAEVLALCATTGEGLDALRGLLPAGSTSAVVGSSGVGKSTLVNRLLGADVQRVLALRAHDATGVHTTTSRRLLALPGGALLVDTPGMREVGLAGDDGGVDAAFADVEALSGACRFRDCAHETEPGCAVKAAVEAGTLEERRLASWRKLLREAEFQARKSDPAARAAAKRAWVRRVADSEARRRLEGRQ